MELRLFVHDTAWGQISFKIKLSPVVQILFEILVLVRSLESSSMSWGLHSGSGGVLNVLGHFPFHGG